MRQIFLLFIGAVLFEACVGVDILDDPIVEKKIILAPSDTSVLFPATVQLMPTYFNEYNIEEEVGVTYFNFNTDLVTVDENGLVTPLALGQARIYAFFEDVISDTIRISVVGSQWVGVTTGHNSP